MITPDFLKPGDTVGIVATGKRISQPEIDVAVNVLGSWGLKVTVGKYVVREEHSYLAATDEHRRGDLQAMIDDPAIRAIICARGGYGSTRILDDVNFEMLKDHPKWVVGFSDVTSVLLKLSSLGVASVHGAMPVNFGNPEAKESIDSLRRLLFGEPISVTAPYGSANRTGSASGKVVGGNISLIVESLGTDSEIDTHGCVLVVEEICEFFYRLDRMMTQLKRAGKLDHLAGLVIGQMTSITDEVPAFGETVEQVIIDKVKAYNYPIAFNFPIGHEQPNIPWVHGSTMRLSVALQGSMLEPGQDASA